MAGIVDAEFRNAESVTEDYTLYPVSFAFGEDISWGVVFAVGLAWALLPIWALPACIWARLHPGRQVCPFKVRVVRSKRAGSV